MENEADGNWSEPVHIFLGDAGEYFSSITHEGVIYFNVWNDGDMSRASPFPSGYATERLNDTLNSTNGDGDPFIAADERYLIFRSYRDRGFGKGDLYISFRINSRWTILQNLGEPINSPATEMTPYATPDGMHFIFSSNRFSPYSENPPASIKDVARKYDTYDNGNQNIYVMSTRFIETMREKVMRME